MLLNSNEADGIGSDKGDLIVRRRWVSRLTLQGLKPQEIADQLGVDCERVRADLKNLRKLWKDEAKRSTSKHVREQLGRIDVLEAEFWEAWESSKKPTTKTSKQTKQTRGGKETTAKVDTTTTSGDPRFLEGVHKCIEQRRKLLGLDAPEKTESTIKIDSDDKGL